MRPFLENSSNTKTRGKRYWAISRRISKHTRHRAPLDAQRVVRPRIEIQLVGGRTRWPVPQLGTDHFLSTERPLCGTNQRKGSFLLSGSASGLDPDDRASDAEVAKQQASNSNGNNDTETWTVERQRLDGHEPSRSELRPVDDRARTEGGRGRSAEKPSDIPARGWKDILWRVYAGVSEDASWRMQQR